ncbi:hypothetical protein D3C85_1205070 [compost metagenome]
MARLQYGLFQDQLGAAEGVLRFRAGGAQLRGQFVRAVHQAHAASAAAGTGLDHQRVADAIGFARQGGVVLFGALKARDAGHARFQHGQLGQALAAHQVDGFDGRADEGDGGRVTGAGEIGVFGEETVARVNGVGAGSASGVDDGIDRQVRLGDGSRADADRLVRQLYVARVSVGLAVDRDRAVAEGLGGAHHPAGDFATVGDQDLVEAGH